VIGRAVRQSDRSDDLATKHFVRGEIAKLGSELFWQLAGMLLPQAGLVLMKLL
jgi:hypothetical protein